jgi:hypothetical protein
MFELEAAAAAKIIRNCPSGAEQSPSQFNVKIETPSISGSAG